MENIHALLNRFRDVLQGIWDDMLPSMNERTVQYAHVYRDLFLLEKLLKAITKELKERALLFPDYYPVKISERKLTSYNLEDVIIQMLISRKYQPKDFCKLKSFLQLEKLIKKEDITALITKGLIVESKTKVVKLEDK